jgi:hypothetical protein
LAFFLVLWAVVPLASQRASENGGPRD